MISADLQSTAMQARNCLLNMCQSRLIAPGRSQGLAAGLLQFKRPKTDRKPHQTPRGRCPMAGRLGMVQRLGIGQSRRNQRHAQFICNGGIMARCGPNRIRYRGEKMGHGIF